MRQMWAALWVARAALRVNAVKTGLSALFAAESASADARNRADAGLPRAVRSMARLPVTRGRSRRAVQCSAACSRDVFALDCVREIGVPLSPLRYALTMAARAIACVSASPGDGAWRLGKCAALCVPAPECRPSEPCFARIEHDLWLIVLILALVDG
jgi:hypothetical protein